MRISFNTHLLFVGFFLLAVIKPINIENINRYMGMFLMLVLVLVFLISYFRAYAYRHIHSRYLFEIIIIILFLGVNLISLWFNLERFNSYSSLIFYAFACDVSRIWSKMAPGWPRTGPR